MRYTIEQLETRLPLASTPSTGRGDDGKGGQFDWDVRPGEIPDGQQHSDLLSAAGSLWATEGMSDTKGVSILWDRASRYTSHRADDPWTRQHVETMWGSMKSYPRGSTADLDPDLIAWAAEPGRRNGTADSRLVTGGSFILDQPDDIPAIWGAGQDVLWAQGEGLMIVGPQGVGKTTLAQQLVLSRIGVRAPRLLGLPVKTADRKVLYLAMDRPSQAARSFQRMVTEDDRDVLNDRLVVHKGPLPFNIVNDKDALADYAEQHDATTVIFDSVKDLAPGTTDEKIASAFNIAWQELIARGVELCLLHHQRKKQQGAKKEHSLDDVFGSNWLTAGLGSVVVLIGEPGDAVVKLKHVKQPAAMVGPLEVSHDHATGTSQTRDGAVDLWSVLKGASEPLTSGQLAEAVHGIDNNAKRQSVQRRLNRMEKDGLAQRVMTGEMTSDGRVPDRWEVVPGMDYDGRLSHESSHSSP